MRNVRFLCVVLLGCKPSPHPSSEVASGQPLVVDAEAAPVEAGPPARRVGDIIFMDAGVQATICELDSPPAPIFKEEPSSACWVAGTSCEGHGTLQGDPFTVAGDLVSGQTIHSGCDLGQYTLVYERNTSPLRLRVCVKRPPPMDCPAMVRDGARWDITSLLEANHATKAVLVKP